MAKPLDDRDRQILAALKADAWLTYPALGEQVCLSASAVQRRVERLIREGVILGAQARVASPAQPEALFVYLLAELAEESSTTLAYVASLLRDLPQVVNAHYVAGEADVALWLEFADMAEYDLFLERHINRSPVIRKFKSLVVLRTLKASAGSGDFGPGLDRRSAAAVGPRQRTRRGG